LDKAIDLPHRGRKKTYDTIIKINLTQKQISSNTRSSFTAKEANQCSRKVKNSLNPHFHEDFVFPIEKLKILKNLVLKLSLYDFERQGRHDAIGHIFLPLNCIIKSGETIKHQLPFKSQSSVSYLTNL
jgi:Ca2+-dependent lipid-binding protein